MFNLYILRIRRRRRIVWPFYHKDLEASPSRGLHLLVESSAKATLFGNDGLGMELTDEICRIVCLVIHEVLFWESVRHGDEV
jgi:hypothetical protein